MSTIRQFGQHSERRTYGARGVTRLVPALEGLCWNWGKDPYEGHGSAVPRKPYSLIGFSRRGTVFRDNFQ